MDQLNSSYLGRIEPWDREVNAVIDGKRVLFVHGSPWNPTNGYVYPDADLDRFAELDSDVVFMGHTHIPFMSTAGNVMVVNVGSCGLPLDQCDLAACAVYDSLSGSCLVYRIQFDAQAVVQNLHGRIHPSVARCLLRRSDQACFGQRVKL